MRTLLLILVFSLVAGQSFHNHHLYSDHTNNNHYSSFDYDNEITSDNCPACLSSSNKPVLLSNTPDGIFTYDKFSYIPIYNLFLTDYLLFHSIASRAPPVA